MKNSELTFTVTTNDNTAGLGFETWLDDQLIFNTDHVQHSQEIAVPVVDDHREHTLKMILKGKLPTHTTVTTDGEIINDAVLTIKDMAVDGIFLSYLVDKLTIYTHDFNGTGPVTQDKFFGIMGCNGSAELKFTAPVYVWLLENM